MDINDWLSLIPPSSACRPRFAALCAAVLAQAADLLPLFDPAPPELSPETAAGKQLDLLGSLAGVPRPDPDTPDADYRTLLRARIAAHGWNGTNGTLPAVLERAFPGQNAFLRDNMNGTVTFTCGGTLPFPPETLVPYPAGITLL